MWIGVRRSACRSTAQVLPVVGSRRPRLAAFGVKATPAASGVTLYGWCNSGSGIRGARLLSLTLMVAQDEIGSSEMQHPSTGGMQTMKASRKLPRTSAYPFDQTVPLAPSPSGSVGLRS